MNIECKNYASPGGDVSVYRLTNDAGAAVELSSLGAGILAVEVPDREGRLENVALSYGNPLDYMADGPCLGKIPGRYANRIARGELTLGGKKYELPVNNGPNHLHGGPDGFQNKIWDAEELSDGVRFSLVSPDADSGYPGTLKAVAEYRWSNDNTLSLTLTAEADAETVVNLTNHAYWNLDGADSGSALAHTMQMKAKRWLPTDDTLIPDGTQAPVAGTPMDFTEVKELGKDIKDDFPALSYGKGYDNCWVLDEWKPGLMIEDAVRVHSDKSGRTLHVDTDQPGVQVYTGNWLAGSPLNRTGRSYSDYDGVAIEAQGFPDAPNCNEFPSQVLKPGETYRRRIIFRFTVE